jgi:hypothetical protein
MLTNLKNLYKLISPKYQKILLEYKVDNRPRYGHGKKPNQELYEIINSNRETYVHFCREIIAHENFFRSIPYDKGNVQAGETTTNLRWNNNYLPGLDILSLYSFIAHYKPKQYVEIGSGNSTMVVHECIRRNNLSTKITSIDPFPRAEIDALADTIIRKPFETLEDYRFIESLNPGDVLFIDNSHRSLPNSDVTVCFLELLPKVPPGVIIHIHDIYLPYDYPQFMCDRFYSEQYLLATLILNAGKNIEILFPAFFVSQDDQLSEELLPLWKNLDSRIERHGGSFWYKKV